jgi:hypothetical protein
MGRKRHGGGGKEGQKWLVRSGRVQKFQGSLCTNRTFSF